MTTFKGSLNEAEAECDRLNETDDGGSTTVLSGHSTREECKAEFYQLTLEEAEYLRQRAGESSVALGDCPESQQWEKEASAMEALADSLI